MQRSAYVHVHVCRGLLHAEVNYKLHAKDTEGIISSSSRVQESEPKVFHFT